MGKLEASPLYDVNPTIYGDSLSLNNMISFELALTSASKFGFVKEDW